MLAIAQRAGPKLQLMVLTAGAEPENRGRQ